MTLTEFLIGGAMLVPAPDSEIRKALADAVLANHILAGEAADKGRKLNDSLDELIRTMVGEAANRVYEE